MGGTILKKRCKFYEPNCNVQSDMARRRNRQVAKIQPCERKLTFELQAGNNYVDVGFALSQLNRKSFRQGYEYAIEKIEVFAQTGDILVQVYRLSNTWCCANAWVKAFHAWKDQQDEWKDQVGGESLQGAYNDFKIYMDTGHATGGISLLPTNCIAIGPAKIIDPLVETDWEYSEFVVPNDGGPGVTDEFTVFMVGPDVLGLDQRGLIHNYALSRSRPFPTDPNSVLPTTDGGLFQDMVDVGENLEEVGENVRSRNDQTPYLTAIQSAIEWYPGGQAQQAAGITLVDNLIIRAGTSAYGSDQTPPFTALCGLLNIASSAEDIICQITVAPGAYKGVMARPMQDVN